MKRFPRFSTMKTSTRESEGNSLRKTSHDVTTTAQFYETMGWVMKWIAIGRVGGKSLYLKIVLVTLSAALLSCAISSSSFFYFKTIQHDFLSFLNLIPFKEIFNGEIFFLS